MSFIAPIIPESAPFNTAQRAWLNGWLAAYYGEGGVAAAGGASAVAEATSAPVVEEDYPWHDMAMPLDERMKLAEARPLPQNSHKQMAGPGKRVLLRPIAALLLAIN